MRRALLTALVSCAERPLKTRTRRFLQGLSSDELDFLAEYLGCCILEVTERSTCSRPQLARRLSEFQSACCHACPSEDREHKTILLLEFLCLSGLGRFAVPARAKQAS